jgi:hypothetical protein
VQGVHQANTSTSVYKVLRLTQVQGVDIGMNLLQVHKLRRINVKCEEGA